MTEAQNRFRMLVWHGEGKSIFYVVDTAAPEDEQPAIVGSSEKQSEARAACATLNA